MVLIQTDVTPTLIFERYQMHKALDGLLDIILSVVVLFHDWWGRIRLWLQLICELC